MTMPINYR